MTAPACRIAGIEKAFGPNKVPRKIGLGLPEGKVTVLMVPTAPADRRW